MNLLGSFFNWFQAPASHAGQPAGLLGWFDVLSIGWKSGQAPSLPPASSPPPMVDATNGQVLLSLLDRIAK